MYFFHLCSALLHSLLATVLSFIQDCFQYEDLDLALRDAVISSEDRHVQWKLLARLFVIQNDLESALRQPFPAVYCFKGVVRGAYLGMGR